MSQVIDRDTKQVRNNEVSPTGQPSLNADLFGEVLRNTHERLVRDHLNSIHNQPHVAKLTYTEPNTEKVESSILSYKDGKMTISFDSGKPITIEARLSDEEWNYVSSYCKSHPFQYTSNHSGITDEMKKAVKLGQLHAAFFSPEATPLNAAEKLRDMLKDLIDSQNQSDWPRAKLVISTDQLSSDQRFQGILRMGDALKGLTDEISYRARRIGEDAAVAEVSEKANCYIQSRLGRMLMDHILEPHQPKPNDLDRIMADTDHRNRIKFRPTEIEVLVPGASSDRPIYSAKILIEQSHSTSGLKVKVWDTFDNLVGVDIKSLPQLFRLLEAASKQGLNTGPARWRFWGLNVSDQTI